MVIYDADVVGDEWHNTTINHSFPYLSTCYYMVIGTLASYIFTLYGSTIVNMRQLRLLKL